jgi:hypothetical protein
LVCGTVAGFSGERGLVEMQVAFCEDEYLVRVCRLGEIAGDIGRGAAERRGGLRQRRGL